MANETTAGFRLSTAQQRVLAGRPEGTPAEASVLVLLDGTLDEPRLERALATLATRCEILRTVYQRHSGLKLPFQVILDSSSPEAKPRWTRLDLSTLSDEDRDPRLQALLEAPAGFDLETGPLLNATLARLAPERHALLLRQPTLSTDARGLLNLVTLLAETYATEATEATAIDDEVMQYADIAQWQADMLESEEARGGVDFWRDTCRTLNANPAPSAPLPFPAPSPTAANQQAVLALTLPERSASGLARLASHGSVTPAAILLTAWSTLLARLTGEPRQRFAVTLDNRKYEELETALGLFALDLPFELNLADQNHAGLLAAARTTQATLAAAAEWQECFSGDPAGDETPAPYGFAWQNSPEAITRAGLTFTPQPPIVPGVPGSLRLVATGSAGSLASACSLGIALHYDPATLARAGALTLAGYFETLLAAALEQPELPLARLPLLDPDTRHRLLTAWNDTAVPYGAALMHALFEEQAARTPDRPAVHAAGVTLSYEQLNADANRLARTLAAHGARPGTLVAFCLDREPHLVTALLAILKTGAAYVALNPDNPPARMAQQLDRVVLLLTESAFAARMPAFAGPTLLIDRDQAQWQDQPSANLNLELSPDATAYVLYTSGSTGVPKGVAVRHRNLTNYTRYIQGWLELDRWPDGLHFATVSTIAADLGNTCIFPSLASGGTLHLLPQATATDARAFAAYTRQHPLDVLKIVPSHLDALLHSAEARELLPRRTLILGGEALTPRLVTTIRALNPACEILNHYGPTETTVGAMTLRLADFDLAAYSGATIPIGRPIANMQAYLLDAFQQPVAPGVAGELYLAGAGVAAGYLDQPALTAERFLPNPFDPGHAPLMYRTGDRARLLPDGNVEFLGRFDDQVKIRGFRIELGEIEAALSLAPGVRQAVALARPDANGNPRLLAWIVPAGTAIDEEAIRATLRDHLPEYMLPVHLLTLPQLPLTPNGKLDRTALPDPEPVAETVFVAPRTPSEEVVAAVWAEVLKLDRVGAHEDFFALGGHSLLATQVVSRLRRTLNVDLPLRTLFDTPTVAGVAAAADSARRGGTQAELPPITPADRTQPLPLSFAQQRLWVLDQLEPDNPLYNIPRRMRMRGPLDTAAFTAALNALVARHESQRTTFAVQNGSPVQVIASTLTLDVPLTSLAHLDQATALAEAQRLALAEAHTPFHLATGPLLRARLLALAPDDHVLLLTMHHIVSDAWSANVFFQELGTLYEAHTQGTTPSLPPLAIQYADYAAWQRQWLTGDTLTTQLDWWRSQLAGVPPLLELRTDRPRTDTRSFQGELNLVQLDPELSKAIRQFSRAEGLTVFMTLLTAFQVLLARYSGQEQVVVGTDLANRSTVETERLIGFFINLLAMRGDLRGNPTVRELLARTRDSALGAYAHQEMPFDRIVEELQPERSMSHNPIVQVLFVMQNIPRARRTLAGLALEPFEVPITRSKFDLAVFAVDLPEGILCHWLHSTDLFDTATVARMATHFETLLRNLLANPDARLNTLEMLSEDEQRQREDDKQKRRQTGLKKLTGAALKTVTLAASELDA